MFIDRAKKTIPTPFGGAEFNLSFNTPDPFRSSERSRTGFGPRAINMLRLRGKTLRVYPSLELN